MDAVHVVVAAVAEVVAVVEPAPSSVRQGR